MTIQKEELNLRTEEIEEAQSNLAATAKFSTALNQTTASLTYSCAIESIAADFKLPFISL